jgi:hypothetical protein
VNEHRRATPTTLVPERGSTAWARSPEGIPHAAAPAADRPARAPAVFAAPVRVSHATAAGSPSRHRSPVRRSRSALGRSSASSPPTTTAILVPPGSRSSTSVRGSSRRSAEQAPPGTTRVGTHGAAPVGRHRRTPVATTAAGGVGSSQAVSPRCGRILGGSACQCSFTPRSPASQASQQGKNQTGMRTTRAAKRGAAAFNGRLAVRVAGRAPFHRSGALPGTPA